jgi:hypothetical protein
MTALDSVKQLRKELELLGSPKVKTAAQLLAEDYQSALISIADPSFDLQTQAVNDFLNSLNAPSPTATMPNYLDDFTRRNPTTGAMNIVVSIDPSAAQYGVNIASINASANGNKNNYSTIQSFAGGLGL